MTYADAMDRYGSDKPDLRFGNELVELTDYFADTPFRVFQADYVGAVVMPGGASQPRKQLDAWQEWAKQRGARGLAYVLVAEDGELGGPVAKNLSEAERAGLAAHVGAQPGRLRLLRRRRRQGRRGRCSAPPGSRSARRCGLIDEAAWAFLWVVDAPLFEPAADAVGPVTSPSATAPGPRCTTPSPRPSRSSWTPSTPTRARRSPTPTTSSATATRSAAARSVSTAATSRSGCSR